MKVEIDIDDSLIQTRAFRGLSGWKLFKVDTRGVHYWNRPNRESRPFTMATGEFGIPLEDDLSKGD